MTLAYDYRATKGKKNWMGSAKYSQSSIRITLVG